MKQIQLHDIPANKGSIQLDVDKPYLTLLELIEYNEVVILKM